MEAVPGVVRQQRLQPCVRRLAPPPPLFDLQLASSVLLSACGAALLIALLLLLAPLRLLLAPLLLLLGLLSPLCVRRLAPPPPLFDLQLASSVLLSANGLLCEALHGLARVRNL